MTNDSENLAAAPRYPVPTNISEEAQAVLAGPIDMSGVDLPVPQTEAEWEERINSSMADFGPLVMASIEAAPVDVTKTEIAGVPVYEVMASDPAIRKEGRTLINLHGGGFTMFGGEYSIMEAPSMAKYGYRVLAVDYRQLPKHPCPAGVNDGVAVYEALLEDGHDPASIAVYGASAGGALTASVIVAARDKGLPLPAAAVMHTPWSDLAKIGDTYVTNEGVDPFLPSYKMLRGAAELYAGGVDNLADPVASPVYADFASGFPPSLLSSGTRDLLLSCTLRLHRALRDADVVAELHVFDAMWHGFALLAPHEGGQMDREVLAFLDRYMA